MTQAEAHEKVNSLIEAKLYTKLELASLLNGMTMPTFYSREKTGKWRQKEIDIINTIG